MNNIEKITKACIAANPQIANGERHDVCQMIHERPIRLSDVLLAILAENPAYRSNINLEPSGQFKVRLDNGSFTEWDLREIWNLSNDDLEHQSEDTLSFIASLL